MRCVVSCRRVRPILAIVHRDGKTLPRIPKQARLRRAAQSPVGLVTCLVIHRPGRQPFPAPTALAILHCRIPCTPIEGASNVSTEVK